MNRPCTRSALRDWTGEEMTTVPTTWTPREAEWLRAAMRQTIEEFAGQIGLSPRAVAKWKAEPDLVISHAVQRDLDTMLRQRASDDERARFNKLAAAVLTVERDRAVELRARLAQADYLHSALAWLGSSGRGDKAEDVLAAAVRIDAMRGARWRRGETHRANVASALHRYYAEGFNEHRPVSASLPGAEVHLTVLSSPDWLAHPWDMLTEDGASGRFVYEHHAAAPAPLTSAGWRRAAEARLAECLVDQTRFTDGRLFRMTGLRPDRSGMGASFTLGSFVRYALTSDLLESETINAVQPGGVPRLPLRDQLMPTVADVLDPGSRHCMGGPLALTAIARPSRRGRPADFALLVQERGGQVLNAAARLAVIPKCFHEPTSEVEWDVDVATSLARELEEELFGKAEVDTTQGKRSAIDPMHPDRLTEPMRYLSQAGQDAWTMEGTGFGFNLLTGNYEFPALIAIHDEDFWERYGGRVEANWEAERVRFVSSLDHGALAALALDPSWSDEGLFAFLLGIRRLQELHPERVALPEIKMGFLR